MVYQWKPASHVKVDAQIAGAVFEELERTQGLSAETLLDASRPTDAPLHGEFEWDDTLAAENYRKTQAQYLIRSICLVHEDERQEPVRAYFQTTTEKVYDSLPVILKDHDKRTALLDTALKELEAFKRKYQQLTELSEVFAAIEKLL